MVGADDVSSKKPFKMAVVTTGEPNDFGFNAMVNEGRIGVQNVFNTTNVHYYVAEEEEMEHMLLDLIHKNYTAIIAGSLEYTTITNATSFLYPNISFMARGGNKNFTNMFYITYNIGICQYLMGFFSGLMTKTNKLGYINPGPPLLNNYNANTFFTGARASNPAITLDYYTSGAWIAPDISTGAANALMDMGVDYISHTQDDFTVGLAAMTRGFQALGTNGFPQRRIYGENIGLSFVTNWTDTYVKFATQSMSGQNYSFKDYGDFSNNFLSLDYAISVPADVRQKMDAELARLTAMPLAKQPYFCNEYLPYVFPPEKIVNGCISSKDFFFIDKPYPGMTYHGTYKVPIVTVPASKDIERGFISAATIFGLLAVGLGVMVVYYKDTHSIRSASPVFCLTIIGGGIMTYLAVIVWVLPMSTGGCVARYWLLTLGYALLIGALVVKNFRIWIIFDNPELKSVRITNPQLLPYVGIVIAILVVLLAVLTSDRVGLVVSTVDKIDNLGPYEVMEVCLTNATGVRIIYGILGVFGVLLLIGVFVSWKIRIVDIDEFNESRPIANVLYSVFFIMFVMVSLLVTPQSINNKVIIICTSALFITTSALAILFVPKFWRIYKYGATSSEMFSYNNRSAVAESRNSGTKRISDGISDDSDDESDGKDKKKATIVTESGVVLVSLTALEACKDSKEPVHATFESDEEDIGGEDGAGATLQLENDDPTNNSS
eukprot:gene4414-5171_t